MVRLKSYRRSTGTLEEEELRERKTQVHDMNR